MPCAELNGTEGGRLLRYDLQSLMTSLKYPENTQISYMKGIIEEKRVKWSDYAPIVVDTLPYYIKAKRGAPVSDWRHARMPHDADVAHALSSCRHASRWHDEIILLPIARRALRRTCLHEACKNKDVAALQDRASSHPCAPLLKSQIWA